MEFKNSVITDLIDRYDFAKIGLDEPEKYTRQQLLQIIVGTNHQWVKELMNPEYPPLKMEVMNMVFEIISEVVFDEIPVLMNTEITKFIDYLKRMPNDWNFNSLSTFPGLSLPLRMVSDILEALNKLQDEFSLLVLSTTISHYFLWISTVISLWGSGSNGAIGRSIILLYKLYSAISTSEYKFPDDENTAIIKYRLVRHIFDNYAKYLPIEYTDLDYLRISYPVVENYHGRRVCKISLIDCKDDATYNNDTINDIFENYSFRFDYPLVVGISDANTTTT